MSVGILPNFVLMLIYEILSMKNCLCGYDHYRKEFSVYAPDPGEEGEEDALKKLEYLNKILIESGFISETFQRGEGTDVIRICKVSIKGIEDMKINFVVTAANVTEIKYQNRDCETCGEKIQEVACQTHEESYEIGHAKNCPYKQIIKEGCVIE